MTKARMVKYAKNRYLVIDHPLAETRFSGSCRALKRTVLAKLDGHIRAAG